MTTSCGEEETCHVTLDAGGVPVLRGCGPIVHDGDALLYDYENYTIVAGDSSNKYCWVGRLWRDRFETDCYCELDLCNRDAEPVIGDGANTLGEQNGVIILAFFATLLLAAVAP